MDLLNKQLIKYNSHLTNKEEVFNEIASLAVEQGIAANKKRVVKGLIKREKESTTGFFDGFAIPHTKDKTINKASVVIIVNEKGIEWESMDGKPARFFISLLIPEKEAGSTHLNLLATVSKMLVSDEARAELLQLDSADQVFDYINGHLEEALN